MTAAIYVILTLLESLYLGWDYNNVETAVLGTLFHSFEWLFIRIAPFVLVGTTAGMVLTRKKHNSLL